MKISDVFHNFISTVEMKFGFYQDDTQSFSNCQEEQQLIKQTHNWENKEPWKLVWLLLQKVCCLPTKLINLNKTSFRLPWVLHSPGSAGINSAFLFA